MPTTYPLDLYRGDTHTWQFTLYDDAAHTDPSNLTGATVKAEFRDRPGGAVKVTFTTVVTLPNIVTMTMTPAMWTGAPPSGAWDLQVTYPGGVIRTVLAGRVVVTPDVTDSVPTPGMRDER